MLAEKQALWGQFRLQAYFWKWWRRQSAQLDANKPEKCGEKYKKSESLFGVLNWSFEMWELTNTKGKYQFHHIRNKYNLLIFVHTLAKFGAIMQTQK